MTVVSFLSITDQVAQRLLVADGILIPQWPGRAHRINPQGDKVSRALRVAFLLNEGERELQMEYQAELHNALTAAGHSAFQSLTSKSSLS